MLFKWIETMTISSFDTVSKKSCYFSWFFFWFSSFFLSCFSYASFFFFFLNRFQFSVSILHNLQSRICVCVFVSDVKAKFSKRIITIAIAMAITIAACCLGFKGISATNHHQIIEKYEIIIINLSKWLSWCWGDLRTKKQNISKKKKFFFWPSVLLLITSNEKEFIELSFNKVSIIAIIFLIIEYTNQERKRERDAEPPRFLIDFHFSPPSRWSLSPIIIGNRRNWKKRKKRRQWKERWISLNSKAKH